VGKRMGRLAPVVSQRVWCSAAPMCRFFLFFF